MFQRLLRYITKKSYPLNTIFISKEKLENNFRVLSNINPKIKIAPVLKSNAYGHGIELIGKLLDDRKWKVEGGKPEIPFICVDSLLEAYQLQKAGIKSEILIMGYIDPQSLQRRKLSFSYAVWDLKLAEAINKYQKGANVHIFVDTGMNREGVGLECRGWKMEDGQKRDYCLEHFIEALKKLENINIVGLMTHLAIPTDPKHPLAKKQLNKFKKAQKITKEKKLNLKWVHIGGGEVLFSIKNLPCNLVRAGKILYGIMLHPRGVTTFKPILKMTTKIVQIKKISKGEQVGYDGTYTTKKDIISAVLPMGYNDGVDRRLSNIGVVLVDGVECPIIGRVSMNVTSIDINNVKNPYVGQEVLIFSDNPDDPNSFEHAAEICKTIPYDLLVHLNPSTKRLVV